MEMLNSKIVEIFVQVDDFLKELPQKLSEIYSLETALRELGQEELVNFLVIPNSRISLSEALTIEIAYHFSGYRSFKDYYKKCIEIHYRSWFPDLVSYTRFVELKKYFMFPLFCLMQVQMQRKCTMVSFVDSTKLPVCLPPRVHQNKIFKGKATWGKTSVGWFWGFKLHLCISHKGDILGFSVAPGNTDDRAKNAIIPMLRYVFGLVLGDRGYQSEKLREDLKSMFIRFDSKLKRNTKRKLDAMESIMVRRRTVIESVFDILKEHLGLEAKNARSFCNYFVNILATLNAYVFYADKSSVHISSNALNMNFALTA